VLRFSAESRVAEEMDEMYRTVQEKLTE